jgi:hypothetical protein
MTDTHVIRIGSCACLGVRRHEPDPGETLFAEIATYLEAVDAFRRAGHEPTWKAEFIAGVLR